jgi:hypothetical protein
MPNSVTAKGNACEFQPTLQPAEHTGNWQGTVEMPKEKEFFPHATL